MSNLLVKLGMVVVGVLASIGSFFHPIPTQNNLTGQLPQSPALVDTYLAAGIGSTDTSMVLANGTTSDGVSLAGFMCFTIDVNSPQLEYVCGTASGTVISNMTRGIGFWNPNTTSSLLAFTHRRLASVQSTDYPTLQLIVRQLSGTDTLSTSGTPLSYDSSVGNTSFTNSQQLASVGYVNSTSFAGAPNGSISTKGIYQEATNAQIASGTVAGSTGADLTLTTRVITTSTKANSIVATNPSGTLDSSFISSSTTYTVGGLISPSTTLNGITTLSTTTISSIPSSILQTNASGTIKGFGFTPSLGQVLYYNGSAWQSGITKSYFQSNMTVSSSIFVDISTTTLPNAASTSVYYFTINFGDGSGITSPSTTIYLSNGNTSTTLAMCNGTPASGNQISDTISGSIWMQNSTSSAFVSMIESPNCNTKNTATITQTVVNMNFSNPTSLNVNFKGSGSGTVNASSSIYMIQ